MAKKKSATKRTAAKTGRKTAAKKKTTAKKRTAKKTAQTKSAKRKQPAPRKKARSKKKARTKPRKRLGPPKITADARLDVLFQKDYQAREVFAFLGVETVRELEAHAPQEIIDQMTRPLVQTVDRIRKALAMSNRCLADDQQFALEFLDRVAPKR